MPRIHFVVGYKAGSDDPEPVYCGRSGQDAETAFSQAGENGFSTAELFRFPQASRRRSFVAGKFYRKAENPEKPEKPQKPEPQKAAKEPAKSPEPPKHPEAPKTGIPSAATKPGNPSDADPLA